MAGITHTKVSGKSDGADATLVLPSDWNAQHTVGDLGGTPAVSLATSSAAGVATTYLRTDDQLTLFDATVPVTQAFGDSAGAGVASVAARRDHKHAMPAVTVLGGTPAPVLSSSAAAGNATTYLRTNDQLALFDTTVPSAATSSGAVGTAAFAARRDHQHTNLSSPTAFRLNHDFGGILAATTVLHIGDISMTPAGTAAGTALTGATAVANHPGVIDMTTGSTSTGNVFFDILSNVTLTLGGGRVRFGCWVNIPVLGTSAQRFELQAGIMDNFPTASVVDGCLFTYRDNINSGAWSVTTVADSVSTATSNITTGVTVNAGSWYRLELEVNAAASSVSYTVDGANTITHIANIPSGAARTTGAYIRLGKTVGATASLVSVDAVYMEIDFTTPR